MNYKLRVVLITAYNLLLAATTVAAFLALAWVLFSWLGSPWLRWPALFLIGAATSATLRILYSDWSSNVFAIVMRSRIMRERMKAILDAWLTQCSCPDCTAKRQAKANESTTKEL